MEENQLLKDKYPQGDLFICDIADAVIKDIMPQMEHPFYSLSKNPVMTARRYEYGKNWAEIHPSYKGMATIYDKDILIYAISQIMAKINNGEEITSRIVKINTRDLLMFCNRGTAGKDYKAICEAIDRLAGTRIVTNIFYEEENEEEYTNYGLIDSGSIRRTHNNTGRLISVQLEISKWVFQAIHKNEVLTLNRDYFRLRKPIERRVYEIARKHCGQQKQWTIGLKKLHIKTGSQTPLFKFRYNIKELFESNHLPDYTIEFDSTNDNVTFKNRGEWWDAEDKPYPRIRKGDTYEAAKTIIPDGMDVYAVEQEWFEHWKNTGRPEIKNPDKAFLGFIFKKYSSED